MDILNQVSQRIAQGVAVGLNQAAQIILQDIQDHVQVKSGRLRDSYSIVQEATPDSWEIGVGSPLAEPGQYGARHYPPIPTWIAEERNRAIQQGNALFPAPGDNSRIDPVIRASVEQSIQDQFNAKS